MSLMVISELSRHKRQVWCDLAAMRHHTWRNPDTKGKTEVTQAQEGEWGVGFLMGTEFPYKVMVEGNMEMI